MATVFFSLFWILLSTAGNCVAVAQYILSLHNPDQDISDVNNAAINFLSIVVQSVACLLLYFAHRICLMFNSVFATYKIVLLLVIFVAAMASISHREAARADFNHRYPDFNPTDCLSAMIYVFYSFEGWEDTNYVSVPT